MRAARHERAKLREGQGALRITMSDMKSPQLARARADAAQQRAMYEFTDRSMVTGTVGIYQRLLQQFQAVGRGDPLLPVR